jgi:hypothetical protein
LFLDLDRTGIVGDVDGSLEVSKPLDAGKRRCGQESREHDQQETYQECHKFHHGNFACKWIAGRKMT